MAKKAKDVPHLRIRLSPQLLSRLERAQEKTGRTMNGEIVARLERSFHAEDQEALVKETVRETVRGILGSLREPSERREPETLPTDVSKLPRDAPILQLTREQLDELRRQFEQEHAKQSATEPSGKKESQS